MKQNNTFLKTICVTLATVGLFACASGTSSNSPAPTPSPTPSPSPTPTPIPPVTPESGVYVAGSGFNYTFSTQPSKGSWYQFSSVSSVPTIQAMGMGSGVILLSAGNGTSNGFLYKVNSNNVEQLNTTSLTTAVTSNTQIVSSGESFVVFTPSVGAVGTKLVAVSSSGNIQENMSFTNVDASTTPPVLTAGSSVSVLNGTFYLFINGTTLGVDNEVYTSNDGVNWTGLAASTVGIKNNTIVMFNNLYYAVHSDNKVYSGSSVSTINSSTVLTSNGGTTNDINSNANVTALFSNSNSFYVYNGSTLYYFGNGLAQQATAQNENSITIGKLIFTNNKLYNYNANTLTQITQVQNNLSLGTTADVSGIVVNNSNNLFVGNPNINTLGAANGSMVLLNSIDASGNCIYTQMPFNTTNGGFAGTPSNYMIAGANGSVLLAVGNEFVVMPSIVNDSVAGTPVPVILSNSGNFSGGALFSNGKSYLAVTTTGTAISNGISDSLLWTFIPTSLIPDGATITNVQVTGGYYYITLSNNNTYQTATPASILTWQQVQQLPYAANYSQFNGVYYVLNSANNSNMNVGVLNTNTGIINVYDNVLPQPYTSTNNSGNISYNGKIFALAQSSTANLWTSESLIQGRNSWQQQIVSFKSMTNESINVTFTVSPTLYWTGNTWVSSDTNNNLVTSASGSVWQEQAFESVPINSTNGLHLF